MMSYRNTSRGTTGARLLAGVLAVCAAPLAFADYVPFPGKIAVKLLDVEAPDIVFVNFESWPGFPRSVRVILPGIVVPEDTPQADDCERQAAKKAMAFTRDFLATAREIYVKDMRMETSADQDAESPVLTDKGSLATALQKEGLARPDTTDPDVSWCAR